MVPLLKLPKRGGSVFHNNFLTKEPRKITFVKSPEEALLIVRKRFGENIYKQGSLGTWSFFDPRDREDIIAECWITQNGKWKLAIHES